MSNIFFDQHNTPFPEDPYYNDQRDPQDTQPMGGQPILLIDPAPVTNLVGENINYGAHSQAGTWRVCGNYKSANNQVMLSRPHLDAKACAQRQGAEQLLQSCLFITGT